MPPPAPTPSSSPLPATNATVVQPPSARIKAYSVREQWLVWLIPAIAIVVGLWLGAKAIMDRGPTITISFRSAEGMEAGKTKIKYKEVDIGVVKTIRLTKDHKAVEVTADLKKSDSVDSLLVEDTKFWVVRPQVSAGGVSGLNTLLSGSYIGLDIGHSEQASKNFVGLEVPPVVTNDLPGRKYRLKAQNMGSLGFGSPVFFRKVPVGQVVAFDLDPDGKGVSFTIFVNTPYDKFINHSTRFWHASGIELSLNAEGVRLSTESLTSVLVGGGIAFQDTDDTKLSQATPAPDNAVFALYEDKLQALKQPDLYGYDYLLLFQNSVRGLSVGAPVDFRGLPIGEVTAINADAAPTAKNPIPKIAVSIRIYPSRMPLLGAPISADKAATIQRSVLDPMVAKGLRAQLRTGNLLTGQLYVTMDIFPRASSTKIDWAHKPVLFPTVQGSLDSLQDSVASIVDKVDHLPIDALGKDLQTTVKSLNKTVARADGLLQQVGRDVTPEASKTLEDARKALNTLNRTLATLEQTVGPEAPLPSQAANAMAEVSKAAKALRATADYLERHPESLLRGKPEDPK